VARGCGVSARERYEAVATAEEVMRLVDELREGGYRRELGCPQRVGRYVIEAVPSARRLYRLTWWQKREPKRRRRPREGVAR